MTDPDWHRQVAVDAYNRTWDLIDKADRTADEDAEMLRTTFASRYHWELAGGDEQRAVGDWQIAHVASMLGEASLALRFAQSALDIAVRNKWTGWRLASCYEGMARAHAVAGNREERDRYLSLGTDELQRIDEDGDRELIASQLASVP